MGIDWQKLKPEEMDCDKLREIATATEGTARAASARL